MTSKVPVFVLFPVIELAQRGGGSTFACKSKNADRQDVYILGTVLLPAPWSLKVVLQ